MLRNRLLLGIQGLQPLLRVVPRPARLVELGLLGNVRGLELRIRLLQLFQRRSAFGGAGAGFLQGRAELVQFACLRNGCRSGGGGGLRLIAGLHQLLFDTVFFGTERLQSLLRVLVELARLLDLRLLGRFRRLQLRMRLPQLLQRRRSFGRLGAGFLQGRAGLVQFARLRNGRRSGDGGGGLRLIAGLRQLLFHTLLLRTERLQFLLRVLLELARLIKLGLLGNVRGLELRMRLLQLLQRRRSFGRFGAGFLQGCAGLVQFTCLRDGCRSSDGGGGLRLIAGLRQLLFDTLLLGTERL